MIGNRRAFFRQGLSDFYSPLYDKLCELLPGDWQPYAGYRTPQAQDSLFKLGREQEADGTWKVVNPGIIRTDAKGGQSPHNYGCATDWTIFDGVEPIWMKKDDPRWQVYLDSIAQIKCLRSGHEFPRNDIDHNELKIALSWRDIHEEFKRDGMGAANSTIFTAMCK